MTDQALSQLCDQVRELLPRVTPGPWRAMRDGNQYLDGVTREKLVGASIVEPLVRPWNKRGVHHYSEPDTECVARFRDDDADFIALAPTMAAALLKLREENERLQKFYDDRVKMFHRLDRETDATIKQAEAKLAALAEIAQSEIGKMPNRWFDALMRRILAIAARKGQ